MDPSKIRKGAIELESTQLVGPQELEQSLTKPYNRYFDAIEDAFKAQYLTFSQLKQRASKLEGKNSDALKNEVELLMDAVASICPFYYNLLHVTEGNQFLKNAIESIEKINGFKYYDDQEKIKRLQINRNELKKNAQTAWPFEVKAEKDEKPWFK